MTSDLVGVRFGKWTVLKRGPMKRQNTTWECRCECGTAKTVQAYSLKNGDSKSCGCLQRELQARLHLKHGKSNSSIFHIWQGMRARCQKPNHRYFHRYGGRGITVCERWLTFENFYADMGDPPPRGQIDRIDNDGNYEPGNCRWATSKQNNRNRCNNTIIELNGESKCLAEWCEIFDVKPATALTRRHRYGKAWADCFGAAA